MTLSNRQYKDAIYEQLARIGKMLASPTRLELIDVLCQGPRNVESLARQSNQSIANTSKNLRQLHAARLVETQRQGNSIVYRLGIEEVGELFRVMRDLASRRLDEVESISRDFLDSRDALEAVGGEELARWVRNGTVLILDVRPRGEFEAGHIAGSVSAPLAELREYLATLPRDRRIVAYCRGPYCVLSVDAVAVLREAGFDAVRLEDGVADWRSRGLAVEQGSPPA